MTSPEATERHRRIEDLFLRASDLPAAERPEFLGRACGEDVRLRAEVEALLGYAGDPRGFLDPHGRRDGSLEQEVPAQIGAYRVVRILGQGGMGTVFLGEQADPGRRRVALKVVRLGMASTDVLARFEVERQALARMNHDFVARVYDTGLTERGQAWFAMEFIDGPPLDRYCDEHRLRIPERLELFASVCEGVQHAHQRGVLHRDIKPSNVLVSVQGQRAVPKVIDFGLARAVDPELTAFGARTVLGRAMGTPGYMSPEQSRGEPIDTRTDIYSLGVLLHELLTGSLPVSDGGTRKPSTCVTAEPGAAERRGTSVGALQRQLRDGLDWIVLKALDGDPGRRYASVSELIADIRRHLEHEPVLAGPPSALYRLQKFLRRHRYAMAVAALLTVVGGIGLYAWLSQTRRTVRALGLARAVNDYLVEDLLERVRPEESLGRKVTVEEVFLDAAAHVAERFAEAPEQEAAVRAVIRDSFSKLGLIDAALRQAELCHELRLKHLGEQHRDTLTAAARLGDLWIGNDEFERGEAMLAEAVRGLREVCGDDDPDTLDYRLALAAHWTFHGRSEQGEHEMQAVIAARERDLGPKHPRTLHARAKLSQALSQRQAHAEVIPLEREILAARREVLGELHPDTLTSMNNLAAALVSLDRLDEARATYEELVQKSLQVRGPSRDHAIVLNNYGNCLQRSAHAAGHAGDSELEKRLLDQAETILTEGLEMRRQVYGERHNKTSTAMVNLAIVHFDRGQFDRAIPLFEEALDIERESLGDNGRNTIVTWVNLATALRDDGQLERSLATFEELLRSGADGLAGQPVTRGVVRDSYGVLLLRLGRPEEAEPELLAGQRDLSEHLGAGHSRTRGAIRHLVNVYRALGRTGEAARWQARLDDG